MAHLAATLSSVLSSPDEPELNVSPETLGDHEETELLAMALDSEGDFLPGFEGLRQHEEGDS
jgi:hypothetical protein